MLTEKLRQDTTTTKDLLGEYSKIERKFFDEIAEFIEDKKTLAPYQKWERFDAILENEQFSDFFENRSQLIELINKRIKALQKWSKIL